MCSNYFPATDRKRLSEFGVQALMDWESPTGKTHVWKGYPAPFVYRSPHADVGDDAVPERELATGLFGLIPHWSRQAKLKYDTFNARSETVANAASFRSAWAEGRRCIIPADAIVEPDWRTGRHVATRISRADGQPMGLAGLWDRWVDPATREAVLSFTMLTINADEHPLMNRFHRTGQEKRMVVILPEASYGEWLSAPVESARQFLNQYPADLLVSTPI